VKIRDAEHLAAARHVLAALESLADDLEEFDEPTGPLRAFIAKLAANINDYEARGHHDH
jgi:hypothetical protein